MAYIIGDTGPGDNYYESIMDFIEEHGMCYEGSDHWCYVGLLWNTGDLPQGMPVSDFLEYLAQEHGIKPIIQFSVTSNEGRYQEWLDAVAGIPGHTIVSVQRGTTNHPYTCYLCTFPTSPNFDNI